MRLLSPMPRMRRPTPERDGPTSFRACRRGSHAVEFALLAPVLCALLLGVLLVGLHLGIAHSLAQLTADTSRYAMVGRTDAERRDLAVRWVARTGETYPLLRPENLEVTTREADGLLVVSARYDASYLPIPKLAETLARLPARIERSSSVFLP